MIRRQMASLGVVLVLLLQFEGIRGDVLYYRFYQRPGDEVLLHNLQVSFSETTCSGVHWLYNKDQSGTSSDVRDGKVEKSSARAARLSLHSNCSLIIKNITAEDAGLYTFQFIKVTNWETQVFLNILTMSPSSTDTEPNEDGEVTLTCSLWRYGGQCDSWNLRWVDEQGAELDGEGDGFKYGGQINCTSFLTVKHQTGLSRRYTCQYVDSTGVKIEAHYTTVSSDSTDWSPLSYVMLALRISSLILMIFITALIIRGRGSTRRLKDTRVHYVKDDESCRSPSTLQ